MYTCTHQPFVTTGTSDQRRCILCDSDRLTDCTADPRQKAATENLRGVGDGTRSGEHGTRGSPPWPERDGGAPLGPTPRPEGLGEVVLAAVALHGAHWAIYHAVMP